MFTVLGHSVPDSGFWVQEEGEQPREAEVRRPYWSSGEAWGLRGAPCWAHGAPLPTPAPPASPGSWVTVSLGCRLCSLSMGSSGFCCLLHGAAAAPSPTPRPVHCDADTMLGN